LEFQEIKNSKNFLINEKHETVIFAFFHSPPHLPLPLTYWRVEREWREWRESGESG
jgi:hypothetical protein